MRRFTRAAGERVQVIGDDYLVTNAARVERAAALGACNAVLIKPNQAGTLTEAQAARDAGKRPARRDRLRAFGRNRGRDHRAPRGRLEDGQLKVGSFTRSERMAKWNEGLRLAESLGSCRDVRGARGAL